MAESNRNLVVDQLAKRNKQENQLQKSAIRVSDNKHNKRTELFFDVNDYLLGECLKARSLSQHKDLVVVIQVGSDHKIAFNNRALTITTDISEQQLRSIALVKTVGASKVIRSKLYLSHHSESAVAFAGQDNVRVLSQEAFFWSLGYVTSRGRMPLNSVVTEKFLINRWPNFPKLTFSEAAMKLVAFWASGPKSWSDALKETGIAESELCSVFCALLYSGLMGQKEPEKIKSTRLASSQESRRLLFKSILGKIKQRPKVAI